jgi:hypothetical protein
VRPHIASASTTLSAQLDGSVRLVIEQYVWVKYNTP